MLISKNFIERLNQYMRENNISQREFSDLVDCSKGYISQLLSGKRVPSTQFIEKLSNATNTKFQYWVNSDKDLKSYSDDNFNSLSILVNMLIEKGLIDSNAARSDRANEMINAMLDAEIKKRLTKLKEKEETD